MKIKDVLGLVLGATFVAACSGAPAPPTSSAEGDDTIDPKTPAKGSAKLPPASNGKSQEPAGGAPTSGTPSTGTPSNQGTPNTDTPGPDGADGADGQAGRISVNEHCCYDGKYFKCPSSAACFGGFDIDACLSTCAGPQDPCFDACFAKLDAAGPPKGCQSNVTPPKGVDCANGSINL